MLYKMVINGSCQGNDIRNILYYRDAPGFTWSNLLFGGAETLADEFATQKLPRWLGASANDYTVDSLDVYPYNDNFQPVVQVPFVKAINLPGTVADPHPGLSACANIRFALEPGTIVNGVWPPRRGYLAFGPIPANWIGEDGNIPQNIITNAGVLALCAAISENVGFAAPVIGSFYPIRVKHNRVLGGLVHWLSFADVKGASMARRASFRRSRMPEA